MASHQPHWMADFQDYTWQDLNPNPVTENPANIAASIQNFPVSFDSAPCGSEWDIAWQGELGNLAYTSFMDDQLQPQFTNVALPNNDDTWAYNDTQIADRNIFDDSCFKDNLQSHGRPAASTQCGAMVGPLMPLATTTKPTSNPGSSLVIERPLTSLNNSFKTSLSNFNDLLIVGSVRNSFRCPWPKCSLKDRFNSRSALRDHLEDVHVQIVLDSWPGCKWPDCKSNGGFKTAKLLAEHVENIHTNPLVCSERECSHQNPFGKQGDLDRHIKSKHREGGYQCSFQSCVKYINNFARKDKLKEHMRNWHGSFECTWGSCARGSGNGFRTAERLFTHIRTTHKNAIDENCPFKHCESSNALPSHEKGLLEEHIGTIHGDYECKLGICGRGHSSGFTPYTLKKHLVKDHEISYAQAVTVVDALEKAGERALKDAQLVRLGWTRRDRDIGLGSGGKVFFDCLSCGLSL